MNNSDKKRVKKYIIKADLKENWMQKIKFIIIEMISESFLSTEIIYVLKF